MRKFIFKIPIGAGLLLSCLVFHLNGFSQTTQPTSQSDQKVRTVIHLLGYLGSDYPGAVKNGKVISTAEYAEMNEFSSTALKTAEQIFKNGSTNLSLIDSIKLLQRAIQQKRNAQTIAVLSDEIKQQIIKRTGFQVSPSQWPDLAQGKRVYSLNCSSCHGAKGKGNGTLAARLTPPPADLTNDSLMKHLSPFEAYNTVHLGVKGTAMPAFMKLSEQETWDVAFYIQTLKYKNDSLNNKTLTLLFDETSKKIDLAEVAIHSDDELLSILSGTHAAKNRLLSLRLHSGEGNRRNSLDFARQAVNEALGLYKEGNFAGARQKALAAYLDGIEPVEAQLRANDPAFTIKLEQQMLRLRAAIDKKKSAKGVKKEVSASLTLLSHAGNMLKDGKLTFWLAFILSGSILLREGLEAFLIIAVMLALIRKTGKRKALLWIHGGWFTALILGVAGWFLSDLLLHIGGRNREMMEGLVTLFAVCVLISAGLWLHNKSHVKHWKKFVEEKIGRLIQTGNMIGLGAFSFMVVFREAFESILFLQAVSIETAPKDQSSIGLGALAAFVVIAILVLLFLKLSSKIPIRLLFRYSSWMIVVLAVILIGNGVHAIQEAGFFPVTPFVFDIRLGWLGIYPTIETIIPQIALIILITSLWHISKWRLKLAG